MNKLQQLSKNLSDRIDSIYNPNLAFTLDVIMNYFWGFVVLVIITIFLFFLYDDIKDDNILVMFFELAYAFTGASMMAYWFFNKETGFKKSAKIKFSESIKEVYKILTTEIVPDNRVKSLSFRMASHHCEKAKRSLEIYDSTNIDDIMDLELFRTQLLNDLTIFHEFEEAKRKLESPNLNDYLKTKCQKIMVDNCFPTPESEAERVSEMIKRMITKHNLNINRRIKKQRNLN